MRTLRHGVAVRLRGQRGFTMIYALGVLLVTSLLAAALFTAVQGDASLSRSDLDGKRAYAAAQAGAQAYLFQLNNNAADSKWWQTCSNDSTSAPISVGNTGATYSYHPVVNSCSGTNAIGTVVDPLTGLLRMQFTGQAGRYGAQRTIVASFRPVSPLSYLWYTKHETIDPSVNANCQNAPYYWQSAPPGDCQIQWTSGDHVNGPMYTDDQFLVPSGNTPTFGRSGDAVASSAPKKTTVCALASACPSGVVQGVEKVPVTSVPMPTDNANLYNDAVKNNWVLPAGTTTMTVNGSTATAYTCTSSDASKCVTTTINLSTRPLIYAPTAKGGSCATYQPGNNTSYTQVNATGSAYNGAFYGTCGDIYVKGSYSLPLTIAADDDVIVTGNLTNQTYSNGVPSGTATLGLVATQYVRVYHPATSSGQLGTSHCEAQNPDVTIDAAILTLQHSFFVDNYGCGVAEDYDSSKDYSAYEQYGALTIHGAIAQYYRGAVGTSLDVWCTSSNNSGQCTSARLRWPGYLKSYNYDDRLGLLLPPYMFDLQNTSWNVLRETLCTAKAPSGGAACS